MGENNRLVTVVLEVDDLDASMELYRRAFGLDLHVDDHQGAAHGAEERWISGRHAATSWTTDAFLHFALYESTGERTTGAQVSFEVEDIETAHARAVNAGALVLHGVRTEPWGRSARYRDHDGNVVGLTQRR